MTSPSTSPVDQPRPRRKSRTEEQADLEAWTLARHERGEHDYWCTPAEAAVILEVSPERVRQLIYGDNPTLPAEATRGGRLLLRRRDVVWAAAHVGPPGDRQRWKTVRDTLVGEGARPPSRPHSPARHTVRSDRVNALPWDDIIEAYQAGTRVHVLIDRYGIGVDTFRHQLRRRGIPVRLGPRPKQLRYRDEELRRRYADGATYARLAEECEVSITLVWRRIEHTRPPRQPSPPGSVFTTAGRKSAEAERAELDAWTYAAHRQDPDPYWCTATDAARLLNLSRDRVRQLIDDGTFPTALTRTNRRLIRTADIRVALRILSRDSGGRLEWRHL